MSAKGVLPVTVSVQVGVSGSLLEIVRVQVFGPAEVGVKRMVRFIHESGLTEVGNGLLIRVKSRQSKTALVTFRLESPLLQIETAFSASVPAETSPKSVESVTLISGTVPSPVAVMLVVPGLPPELLETTIEVVLVPDALGSNLILKSNSALGLITVGKGG